MNVPAAFAVNGGLASASGDSNMGMDFTFKTLTVGTSLAMGVFLAWIPGLHWLRKGHNSRDTPMKQTLDSILGAEDDEEAGCHQHVFTEDSTQAVELNSFRPDFDQDEFRGLDFHSDAAPPRGKRGYSMSASSAYSDSLSERSRGFSVSEGVSAQTQSRRSHVQHSSYNSHVSNI